MSLMCGYVFADGLLLPVNEDYPRDFLRNRLTQVTVKINGLVAETEVYQEFINEWNDSTDAVYSFPLPPEARATEFVYWYDDNIYKAILKVKEQATNPGTGEGGVAALVNKYIGRNGIKIRLKGIQAGAIQKVRLHYISLLDYYQGKCTYEFPLKTSDFVTHTLDHLQFNFDVQSNSEIISHEIPTHPDYQVTSWEGNHLNIELSKPKAWLTSDLQFSYTVDHTSLGVDFFSVANDTSDGHFALFVRPQNQAEADSVFNRRIIFLLSSSNQALGYKLSQSIDAIGQMLDKLSPEDEFNIVHYNYNTYSWKSGPLPANTENVQAAKTFLYSISASYGSDIGTAIEECLNQINDDNLSNTIIMFSDGYGTVDPKAVAQNNLYRTGIFPVGIGDDLSRERLEMIAEYNYGFTTYIDDNDNIPQKANRLFNQISQPILKNVAMEYGNAILLDLIPEKIPATYAGSYFMMTGRYKNPGTSAMSIAGSSVNGMTAYDFHLDFSGNKTPFKFAEYLWAKSKIDALEREIEVYEETPALKDELIDLSLKYNIRCRYTAYIADYETEYTTHISTDKIDGLLPQSYLAGNYPNPFNPATTIRLYIQSGAEGQVKFLKIYNMLGQLVAVIDISHLKSGWHEVRFYGMDYRGNILPSGVYIVQLQVGGQPVSRLRVNLVK
jgi:Ca-activated chloride channel family protein